MGRDTHYFILHEPILGLAMVSDYLLLCELRSLVVHLLGGGQHVVLLRCQLSPESQGHSQQGLVSYRPHFSASASLGEPERCRAVPTAAPSNMNRRNAHARKASIQPTKTLKAFIRSNKNKGPMCTSTGITTAPVTLLNA